MATWPNDCLKNPRQYIEIEWSVPIQRLEVKKVNVGDLQKSAKPITPLSYIDGPFQLQHLNILLPPLPIKEYDLQSGKLVLSLSDSGSTSAKLLALQESLLTSVYGHQRKWFPDSERSKEMIQALFQPFLESDLLHLYCPLQTQEKRHSLHIWKEGGWKRLSVAGLIQKGDSIRVALRLQGISFQLNPSTNSWTGRFRVQHRIFSLYHCSKP